MSPIKPVHDFQFEEVIQEFTDRQKRKVNSIIAQLESKSESGGDFTSKEQTYKNQLGVDKHSDNNILHN